MDETTEQTEDTTTSWRKYFEGGLKSTSNRFSRYNDVDLNDDYGWITGESNPTVDSLYEFAKNEFNSQEYRVQAPRGFTRTEITGNRTRKAQYFSGADFLVYRVALPESPVESGNLATTLPAKEEILASLQVKFCSYDCSFSVTSIGAERELNGTPIEEGTGGLTGEDVVFLMGSFKRKTSDLTPKNG